MANGVLLLTGPPGSGKTTTARLIATAASGGAHIEADEFFHFVRGGYVEPWLPDAARGHVVSYAILRPPLATCIARAGGRAGDALSQPEVVTQLWNDFGDLDGLERHVVDVEDLEPEPVAHKVASRWRAAALHI